MKESVAFSAHTGRAIADHLARSEDFDEYKRAFEQITGLPLNLQCEGAAEMPHRGGACENPFCALMGEREEGTAACTRMKSSFESAASKQGQWAACFAGLSVLAVPVVISGRPVAFLWTGQVRESGGGRPQVGNRLEALGFWIDTDRAKAAFQQTRVLGPHQRQLLLRLLGGCAKHLAEVGAQRLAETREAEPPQIARARSFIAEHQDEVLPLGVVAREVQMSAFYFCKLFKQSTGFTFTDYLARVRVEKVKRLLMDPRWRVADIATAAGFRSLSQFNRVFRRVAGEAPSVYRARFVEAAAGS